MLLRVLCLAALILVSSSWATSRNYVSDWMKRATELGLDSGHVVIKYSLTDECELGRVEVLESTSDELYTADAIAEIVRDFVGPFNYMADTLPNITGTDDKNSARLSFNRRNFSWQNEHGHEYVACMFYLDGQLFAAEFVDLNRPPAEYSPTMSINVPLSDLKPVVRKFAFRIEE